MKITPIMAPVINESAMQLELRRELGSLENSFILGGILPNIDSLLHFGFLIEKITADQALEFAGSFQFGILKYHLPTRDFPVTTMDILVVGSAAEFLKENTHEEIVEYLKHYKRQVN